MNRFFPGLFLSLTASLLVLPASAVSNETPLSGGATDKAASASTASDRGASPYDDILFSLLAPADTGKVPAAAEKQDAPVSPTKVVSAPATAEKQNAPVSATKAVSAPAAAEKQDAPVSATKVVSAPVQSSTDKTLSQIDAVLRHSPLEEKPKEGETVRISLAGGYGQADSGSDRTGWCVQGEILFNIPQTPIDIDFRGFYDHLSDYGDTNDDLFSGSAQVRLNLNRNGIINPYISGGAYYQEHKWKRVESVHFWYHGSWGVWEGSRIIYRPDSEDGFGFIASAGVEMKLDPVYLRLDGSVLNEGQFEILAIVGVNLSDHIRLEGGCRYFNLDDYCDYRYSEYRYSELYHRHSGGIHSRQCFFAGLSIGF